MRDIKPRNPERYNNKFNDQPLQIWQSGNYCLNPKLGLSVLLRPSYSSGMMIFRPWPQLDYQDPKNKLQPSRHPDDFEGSFTNWIVSVPCVTYMGIPETGNVYSFNLYDVSADDAIHRRDTNPYIIFYKACKNAAQNGSFGVGMVWRGEWNKLMFVDMKKATGPAIPRPSRRYYIQGHCYRNENRFYIEKSENRESARPYGLGHGDPLVVIQLSENTGRNMEKVLNKRKPQLSSNGGGETSSSTLYDHNDFLFPDPTGQYDPQNRVLNGGVFIVVYNPRVENAKFEHTSWSGEIQSIQSYEVAVVRSFTHKGKKYTPDMDKYDTNQIFQKAQFWFDDLETNSPGLLLFLPYEQQMELIAKAFSDFPDLVEYAFADHPEYLTDNILSILRKRKTFTLSSNGNDDDVDIVVNENENRRAARKLFQIEDDDEEEDVRSNENERISLKKGNLMNSKMQQMRNQKDLRSPAPSSPPKRSATSFNTDSFTSAAASHQLFEENGGEENSPTYFDNDEDDTSSSSTSTESYVLFDEKEEENDERKQGNEKAKNLKQNENSLSFEEYEANY